jgi:hypothetical protein
LSEEEEVDSFHEESHISFYSHHSSSESSSSDDIEVFSHASISAVIAENICPCHCNREWSYNFVELTRRTIHPGTRKEHIQVLKAKMEVLFPQGSTTAKPLINGHAVCLTSWKALYGVTNYTFYLVLNSIKDNTELNHIHGNALRDYTASKSEMIHAWLVNYINLYRDKMPHNNDVYLPMRCEKSDLYDVMKEELASLYSAEQLPEPNTFYQVWAKDFPYLKIPQCVTLGKCDYCCDLTN